MYSRKRSLRDRVIKLRDNWIFKALLWIKKSLNSIDFDLAIHALVSEPFTFSLVELILINQGVFFLIGIHPMQGWTATTRHGVTRKKAQKRLQDTENLSWKNLQLKDGC